MNRKAQRRILRGVGVYFLSLMIFVCTISSAYADFVPFTPVTGGTTATSPNPSAPPTITEGGVTGTTENVNIRSSTFKFVVCDGPVRPEGYVPNPPDQTPYIPCDFKGLVLTVQHFLNIAMVLGVMGTIVTAVYAGYLYVTGKESNISKAKEMLPKVGIGFVLMLTAWFIIAQILTWLTNNDAFKTFLKL
jgi:hypothetical protein